MIKIKRIKKIYDNDGESFDRYSIIYQNGDFLGMSHNPTHPQGFCCWACKEQYIDGPHLGKEIDFTQLPKECQNHLYNIEHELKLIKKENNHEI